VVGTHPQLETSIAAMLGLTGPFTALQGICDEVLERKVLAVRSTCGRFVDVVDLRLPAVIFEFQRLGGCVQEVVLEQFCEDSVVRLAGLVE
jgi:hypothetical protein